ncbi:MAG: hypothetical protein ACRD08_08725, partial [Acidimicrobiales bacterium]
MKSRNVTREAAAIGVGVVLVLQACALTPAREAPARVLGAEATLGEGTVSSYTELGAREAPSAIGLVFTAGALRQLTTEPTDRHHCTDRNEDGKIDAHAECFATHEYAITLPDAIARRGDIPFKWVLLNWNPGGHLPPGVYDTPHFDIHFYMDRIESVFAIEAGPCGPEFVRCDQFAAGRRPVPANYMHPDFKNVDAVAPAMGNHLIDPTSAEFNGKPFTRTWIYGSYDGRVTFYEEMVTLEYLK